MRGSFLWLFVVPWACGDNGGGARRELSGSMEIEQGAAATANPWVTVELSAEGATTVQLGEEKDLSDASTEPFSASLQWAFSAKDGEKTLYARFFDDSGHRSAIVSDSIVLDTVAPELQAKAPAFSASETIRVEGTVKDATEVGITVNEMSAKVTDGAFTADIELESEGGNSISVLATDAAGNPTSTTLETVRDTVDPAVTIDSPEEGALVRGTVEVAGTVLDATTVMVSVNDTAATVEDGAYIAILEFTEETAVVVALATDAAGNTGVSAERTVQVDRVAPVLEVIAPVSGTSTNKSTVTVRGTVSDAMLSGVTANGVVAAISGDEFFVFGVLLESGVNTIDVIASDLAGNTTTAEVTVERDEDPPPEPTVLSVTPEDSTVAICGTAEDGATVLVAVGDTSVSVTAEGGEFCATVEVPESATHAFITAVDAAGNTSTTLEQPLDDDAPTTPEVDSVITSPTSRQAVILYGVAEPGARIEVTGGRELAQGDARSDTGFFFVGVLLKINQFNTLSIVAKDATGNPSDPAVVGVDQREELGVPAKRLTLLSGQGQRAIENTALALPLEVVVCDALRQPIANAEVTFEVVGGGGSIAGATDAEVTTGTDGRAQAQLTVGPAVDAIADNWVLADFSGNEGEPVLFKATSVATRAGESTTVSGLVLGNGLEPVVNAEAVIAAIDVDGDGDIDSDDPNPNAGKSAVTDENGEFLIFDVTPALQQHVFINPENVIETTRKYPPMTQVIDALEGHDNDLGKPIFLPEIDTLAVVSAAQGGRAQSSSSEDLFLDVTPGQVTLDGQPYEGEIYLSPVPTLRLPMPLTGGLASGGIVSVMPANAVFDPPAAITYPNLDGLAPSAPAQIIAFDHDLGRFVVAGSATVSEDGRRIVSDPGSGVRKGAWQPVVDPVTGQVTGYTGDVGSRKAGQKRGDPLNGPGSLAADPVELSSGAYFHQVTDLAVPGRHISFSFERFYSSGLSGDGPLGHGWKHNLASQRLTFELRSQKPCSAVGQGGASLSVQPGPFTIPNVPVANSSPFSMEVVCPPRNGDDDDISYENGSGHQLLFRALGGGQYESPPEMYAVLRKDGNAFLLTHRGGVVERFDQDGRLRSIEERHGDTMRFEYDNDGNMVSIADPYGRVFRLGYDSDGHIVTLTDYTFRRVWRYVYDSHGDLVSVTAPATTEFPSGTTVRYAYDSGQIDEVLDHNMTAVTDERGETWLTMTYGKTPGKKDFDRVITQRETDHVTTIEYEDVEDEGSATSLTRVIDPTGAMSEHLYDSTSHEIETRVYANLRIRSTDPPVFITRREFNAAGEMVLLEKPRGNRMVYEYDQDNADPCARQNLLRIEAQPGSLGTEAPIVRSFSYEPRFQLVKSEISPRGNDPAEGPAESFTTTFAYDYEKLGNAELNPSGLQMGAVVQISYRRTTLEGPTEEIVSSSQHNRFGQVTRIIDPNGVISTMDYYPECNPSGTGIAVRSRRDTSTGGYLRSVTLDGEDAAGVNLETNYFYDALGRVVKVESPSGAKAESEFDNQDQVVKTIDALEQEVHFRYDEVGNLLSREEAVQGDDNSAVLGTVLTNDFGYDAASRYSHVSVQVDASTFATTSVTYDGLGRIVTKTSPTGMITTNVYDERGLLRSVAFSGVGLTARTTTFEYDENGNLLQTVDPEGHVTSLEYDPFDRVIVGTSSNGTRVETTFDAAGNVVLQRTVGDSPAGPLTLLGQTRAVYDELNRPIRTETDQLDPSGIVVSTAQTKTRYDRAGRVVEVTDAAGNVTTFEYDGAGRLVATQDALGNRSESIYGEHPSPIQTTVHWFDSETGAETSYVSNTEYDLLERPLVSTNWGRETTRFTYDSRGELVQTRDHLGNVLSISYDGRGLKTASRLELHQGGLGEGELDTNEANPDGVVENRWVYDLEGRLTDVISDAGSATHYSYNLLGELVSTTDPLGRASTFTYDRDGQLIRATEPSGTEHSNTYDTAHRLTRSEVEAAAELLPTGAQEFEYDGIGRALRALDSNDPSDSTDDVEIVSSYNSVGLATQTVGTRTISLAYDSADRLQSLTYPDETQLNYTYDALNRPFQVAIVGEPQALVSDAYVGPDLVRRASANGVTTTVSYNSNNDISSIEQRNADGVLLDGYQYSYRMAGQPVSVARLHDGGLGDAYHLDSLGRLIAQEIESDHPAEEAANRGSNPGLLGSNFTLDGDSNRRQEQRASGTVSETIDYETDSAGAYVAVGGVSRTYDTDGQLTSDSTRELFYDGRGRLRQVARGAAELVYRYDALGRLVKIAMEDEDQQTDITPWAEFPLEERDAGGATTAQYYAVGADLLAADVAGARSFAHTDRLGSITALTDADGQRFQSYAYDPFGSRAVTDAAGTLVDATEAAVPYGFTAQRHDEAAGLILFPARALDPATGQFLTRDPLGAAAGPSRYGYVQHSPTALVDPLGLAPCQDIQAISTEAGKEAFWESFIPGSTRIGAEWMQYGALAPNSATTQMGVHRFINGLTSGAGLKIVGWINGRPVTDWDIALALANGDEQEARRLLGSTNISEEGGQVAQMTILMYAGGGSSPVAVRAPLLIWGGYQAVYGTGQNLRVMFSPTASWDNKWMNAGFLILNLVGIKGFHDSLIPRKHVPHANPGELPYPEGPVPPGTPQRGKRYLKYYTVEGEDLGVGQYNRFVNDPTSPHFPFGLQASIEGDVLHLYIKAGSETPKGRDMFREAINWAQSQGPVRHIQAEWIYGGRFGTSLASNYESFWASINEGYSARQAASRTFTGRMAGQHGYTVVGSPTFRHGSDCRIDVTFSKP